MALPVMPPNWSPPAFPHSPRLLPRRHEPSAVPALPSPDAAAIGAVTGIVNRQVPAAAPRALDSAGLVLWFVLNRPRHVHRTVLVTAHQAVEAEGKCRGEVPRAGGKCQGPSSGFWLLPSGLWTLEVFGRVVPEVGVEPTHPEGLGILSPARLPVPPLRRRCF